MINNDASVLKINWCGFLSPNSLVGRDTHPRPLMFTMCAPRSQFVLGMNLKCNICFSQWPATGGDSSVSCTFIFLWGLSVHGTERIGWCVGLCKIREHMHKLGIAQLIDQSIDSQTCIEQPVDIHRGSARVMRLGNGRPHLMKRLRWAGRVSVIRQ